MTPFDPRDDIHIGGKQLSWHVDQVRVLLRAKSFAAGAPTMADEEAVACPDEMSSSGPAGEHEVAF